MKNITWVYSNESEQWMNSREYEELHVVSSFELDGREYQKMLGFGACFNEAGWRSLNLLDSDRKDRLLNEFFSKEGCDFQIWRLPVGANDYSDGWYSFDETPGDYDMTRFSIERDEVALLPYISAALRRNPGLTLFASPWSPPTWMKTRPVYNGAKFNMTEKNLRAYALYLAKFVQEYAKRGISIHQLHVQNEPVANQKFPSCLWTGEELKVFIRDYLGPKFAAEKIPTEIWLGTINAPGCDFIRLIFDKWATEDYDYFANTVLIDDEARKYIAGVSYQWGGKIAIQRTFESWWPQIRLMQSENECGFGDNTWEYALYTWTMLKHYISNGSESYIYWNPVLQPNGVSTWGDPQNAMVTIDPVDKSVILNPDFYVMKHFSAFVNKGSIRLGGKGPFAGDTLAFKNPDGSLVLQVFNPFGRETNFTALGYAFRLPPRSINTIRFQ